MTYKVYDCLADCEVGIFPTLADANLKRKQWGGECTHVFEIAEPEANHVKPAEIKETKPLAGMLF